MAGYANTPLFKKLGIKEQARVALVNAPPGFRAELGPLPAGASIVSAARPPLDLVLLFAATQTDLSKNFARLASRLTPAGMLWVAWPKKASGVATDLSFAVVQAAGMAHGLVDTKICAVNDTWSGLRFVVRVKDRPR